MTCANTAGLGAKLRHLIELLDGDVQAVYTERGLDYRPRFTPVMKALIATRPANVKDIARRAGLTHSATSQTVGLMKREGLLTATPGRDSRTQMIDLTERGAALLPELQQCWAATDAAAAALDAELVHSLADAVVAATEALERTPFKTRIHAARHRQSQAPGRSL